MFIGRPILAWVIAILISFAGILAVPSLPISQYPQIAPPQITVRAIYVGASRRPTRRKACFMRSASSSCSCCWRGFNDIYFKVGLITIMGLAAKNAILIVEFAKELWAQGRSLRDSAIEAAKLRFRPIQMTSLAFTLGVVPMATATGASSASQNAIGIGVIGGMIAATVFSVFFVPVFFVLVLRIFGRKKNRQPAGQDQSAVHVPETG